MAGSRETLRERHGIVYVLKGVVNGRDVYKIGRTSDLPKRVSNIQIQVPFMLDVLFAIQTTDRWKLERELFERFDSRRVNGEWFHLTAGDVEWLRELARAGHEAKVTRLPTSPETGILTRSADTSVVVSVRLTTREKATLEALADSRQCSPSEILRMGIEAIASLEAARRAS